MACHGLSAFKISLHPINRKEVSRMELDEREDMGFIQVKWSAKLYGTVEMNARYWLHQKGSENFYGELDFIKEHFQELYDKQLFTSIQGVIPKYGCISSFVANIIRSDSPVSSSQTSSNGFSLYSSNKFSKSLSYSS